MDEYSLKSAGEELAKFADAISQLESRSRSEILFPYIFFASKKMSSRAISRWLSDERGIDFSAASVAKTLRECDKYFALIAERAHILAEHLAEQFDGCAEEILCQPFGMDRIRDLIDQNIPGEDGITYTQKVINELHEEWFKLDDEIRCRCRPFFDFTSEPENETKEENEHTV